MAGELSNVKQNLSNNYTSLFEDNPQLGERLRRAIPDDVIEAYEQAFDTDDAKEALSQAAATGALEDDYSNVYNQFPELRTELRKAGRNAFSDSDKRALAEAASSADISRLYNLCYSGEIQEVADTLNLDSTPNTASECAEDVTDASGLADTYERMYKDQ